MLLRSKPPLQIHPTPFKPSLLSITPSPFSPLTPLSRPRAPTTSSLSPRSPVPTPPHPTQPTAIPPASPLSWMWQCHHCQRTYPLGTTRRCLDDGHLFCSGTTAVKKWREPVVNRRVKRHKACASEFDYAGWKAWGRWKRGGVRRRNVAIGNGSGEGVKKNCWNTCDYPSECRWGKKVGIHTPSPEGCSFPATLPCPPPLTPPASPATEPIIQAHHHQQQPPHPHHHQPTAGNKDFFTTLLASAKRRKSSHIPSPLAAPHSPAATDSDGDVEMSAASPSRMGSVAMDMLKDVMLGRKAGRIAGRDGVPMLTVGKSVDVEMEGMEGERETGNGDGDGEVEFAPLVRIGSRN